MQGVSKFEAARESMTRFFARSKKCEIPPRLSNPVRFPFGEFEFQIAGGAGDQVEIEASWNLKHWERLEGVMMGKRGAEFSDKGGGEFLARFYRASSGSNMSNILGFAVRTLPPGYSMVSNPFSNDANTIARLLPGVPEGTMLNKFSMTTFQLNKTEFTKGAWSNLNETLGPGEGMLFFNPADTEIRVKLVGEVLASMATVSIHQGMSMRSSMLPMAGLLDADLGFPITEGDVVSMYSSGEEKYIEHKFENGKWQNGAPFVRMCEAFWIAKNESATWTQQVQGLRVKNEVVSS